MVDVGVVIPAAGSGKRMGAGVNKQFLTLAGLPILAHTIRVFQFSSNVAEIVIVGAEDDLLEITAIVKKLQFDKVRAIVAGGFQRQDSVFAGIKALAPVIQRIVVHDGARPLLTLRQLDCFLEEAQGNPAAIMAIQVKDTIKLISARGMVVETLPRELLRAAQTPQVFERALLEKVHHLALEQGFYGTDDASLLEYFGYQVAVLEGSWENLKITTPQDLWLAEYIMGQRKVFL
ncbi:MAG TPA: 2-C-methyl-D-erythritol 4-phosphate cytidylyltransferase [Desulfitobacteriaceae bacterium]|nr:2-C-methyl-D-erythritol 4-phosphate cytidylyltransferase [Desulfitobacteriaceae bacterium]